jgi:hypothetical protein
MAALETALAVVEWALAGSGPPPRGHLRETQALARPDARLSRALGVLASVTAARLRFGSPPLGDTSPLGAGGAVLAAAIGSVHPPNMARVLADAIPPAHSAAEWLLRHGLLLRARPYIPPKLYEDLLPLSPLTALLDRPAAGQKSALMSLVERLLAHPAGRLSLQLTLAQPTSGRATRTWRTELLDRLRLGDPDFVLDVYEAGMIHFRDALLAQVEQASAALQDPSVSENNLADALSIGEWWGPLSMIERSDPEALRARRHLGYDYRAGLALYRTVRRLNPV